MDKDCRARAGVGILMHEKFETMVDDITYVNQNLMYITLNIEKEKHHFISIYAPDITRSREEREQFFDQLQETLRMLPNNDKIFIMGDFNSRIGNQVIPGVMQRYNEEISNENGNMLLDICAHNELRINNTFFDHKEQHKYTFHNTRGQKSMIDFVITNRRVHPSQILDVRTLTSANVGTQHGLVLCEYRLKQTKIRKKSPIYISKFNTESLREDSTRDLYQRRLNEKISQNIITLEDSVDMAWNKIKQNIIHSAKEAIGQRKININGRKNTKPWFTEEVKDLSKEKKMAYIRYINNRSPEEYQKYKVIRNRTNDGIKQLKKEYWERFSVEMEHDLYGCQKRIWNMLRKRKKNVTEEVQMNNITTETWTTYYQNLYSNCTDNREEQRQEYQETYDEGDAITMEEVQTAVQQLKNRKSPGTDNITNEMIKYGGREIHQEITKLFQNIIRTGEVPREWKTSLSVPIYKKGKRKDPDNYRNITLLNSTHKLFTKILTNKISSQVNISEEQQGFRRNRSTVDAIFTLRQMIEKSIEFNKPMFTCFLDLTKAFDRIRLHDVLEILQAKNISEKYIRIIKHLNTHNTTRIKHNVDYLRRSAYPQAYDKGTA